MYGERRSEVCTGEGQRRNKAHGSRSRCVEVGECGREWGGGAEREGCAGMCMGQAKPHSAPYLATGARKRAISAAEP